ncbi:MAG: hypothetical protein GX876_00415 [Bacteroidales bacterium]|nr:hypothetical protein [Bacteroidales bacterium]
MEIIEVSFSEYKDAISSPYFIFGDAGFNSLNSFKAEKVFYLLFKEGKVRLGIIMGYQNKVLKSPFSAPFGGFSFVSEKIRLHHIEEAIKILSDLANSRNVSAIEITLPPLFYNYRFISKQINCFHRAGYVFSAIDLNFSCDILSNKKPYQEQLWRNSRKNLRIASEANLSFIRITDEKEKRISYEIISENRAHRGFPLRMTWDQIQETEIIIPIDYFLVKGAPGSPIAAAIVFHVTDKIVQVVYWGDLPGHTEVKPMNFLASGLYEYYKALNIEFLDIGPSTENSLPNYGLCEFKESLGCTLYPKFTMYKSFR